MVQMHRRYIGDFLKNRLSLAHIAQSQIFVKISGIFDISAIFFRFFFDFFASRLSVANIVSRLADNRFFGDISAEKTEILFFA